MAWAAQPFTPSHREVSAHTAGASGPKGAIKGSHPMGDCP